MCTRLMMFMESSLWPGRGPPLNLVLRLAPWAPRCLLFPLRTSVEGPALFLLASALAHTPQLQAPAPHRDTHQSGGQPHAAHTAPRPYPMGSQACSGLAVPVMLTPKSPGRLGVPAGALGTAAAPQFSLKPRKRLVIGAQFSCKMAILSLRPLSVVSSKGHCCGLLISDFVPEQVT